MKKYYKIKKGVDLKELEKYGYTKLVDWYYKEMENGETIYIDKCEIDVVGYDSYSEDNYDFNLFEYEEDDEEYGYYYEDMGEEYIPDLIKAGLVEKY